MKGVIFPEFLQRVKLEKEARSGTGHGRGQGNPPRTLVREG